MRKREHQNGGRDERQDDEMLKRRGSAAVELSKVPQLFWRADSVSAGISAAAIPWKSAAAMLQVAGCTLHMDGSTGPRQ